MRATLPASIVLGLIWNVIAVRLMSGGLVDALRPSWMIAGGIAGLIAGFHTVWSRRRSDGTERFLDGLATYYLAIVAYWMIFVVIERAILCVQHGGWTDFDLHDHLLLIGWLGFYGTFWYGIFLIPLCFLCRSLVWRLHRWNDVLRTPAPDACPR